MRKVAAGFMFLVLIASIFVWHNERGGDMPIAATQEREQATPAREAFCKRGLDKLNGDKVKIWKRWERRGDVVEVWVWPGFNLLDLDQKRVFDSTIRCTASEGRNEDQGITVVRYTDAYSGKKIGSWGEYTGFAME